MKNNNFKKTLILILLIVLLGGCSGRDITPIFEENEIEKNIENKQNFINNLNELKMFKNENKPYDTVGFTESESMFFDAIDSMFIDSNVIYDGQLLTKDAFLEMNYFDMTSHIYIVDIDDNGYEDYIFTYKFSGTGMFSGIDKIFLKDGETYTYLNDQKELISNFFDIVSYKGSNYVYTSENGIDRIYKWENKGLKLIFEETLFIDNLHLNRDYSELNKKIHDTYKVDFVGKTLRDKGIDFSLSVGYSNEEILITFFKIKDFIENDRREDLANMICFPIVLWKDDVETKLYNKIDFLDHYDDLISKNIQSIVQESQPEDIFASWRGAMLGSGEIWFTTHIHSIYPMDATN